MAIRVRTLSESEKTAIERLVHSRTEAARQVERARMILYSSQGEKVPAIARRLEVDEDVVRLWLKRFNAEGLKGLSDRSRSGRPAVYNHTLVSTVIATALTHPKTLDLPFACWTLDRLKAYLKEHKQIGMKRSRIDEVLIAEGLRWRKQESWFGERVDPEFAEKRGASNNSTQHRLPEAS
jgi:transposase